MAGIEVENCLGGAVLKIYDGGSFLAANSQSQVEAAGASPVSSIWCGNYQSISFSIEGLGEPETRILVQNRGKAKCPWMNDFCVRHVGAVRQD